MTAGERHQVGRCPVCGAAIYDSGYDDDPAKWQHAHMCEHIGLECLVSGCFCECECCEWIRQDEETELQSSGPSPGGNQ